MPPRLTDAERAERAMSSTDVQAVFTGLALVLGWDWVHFRAARERGGWRVPVDGPLGEGWPDVFLAHPGRGLTIGVECKREKDDEPTERQRSVHAILRAAGMPVYVVRPSDVRDPLQQSRAWKILREYGRNGES